MSQLHGINGAQQPQATGISPSVGKLGLHSVQLGTNPPVRLDAIKGNKIPFAGFRTATKVVNAKTGARENAALALRSLASPDGKLDAKALLNAAKSMQTHLNRLGTLGEIRGTMDDAVIAAFAPEVESLSNTELLNAYQQFLSPEMSLLKPALQAEMSANPRNEDVMAAAANLFSLEALVTKEASNRIIIAQGLAQPGQIPPLSAQYGAGIEGMAPPGPTRPRADMSAVSMHVLMDVAIDSSARRERVGGLVARYGQPPQPRKHRRKAVRGRAPLRPADHQRGSRLPVRHERGPSPCSRQGGVGAHFPLHRSRARRGQPSGRHRRERRGLHPETRQRGAGAVPRTERGPPGGSQRAPHLRRAQPPAPAHRGGPHLRHRGPAPQARSRPARHLHRGRYLRRAAPALYRSGASGRP